MPRKPRRYGRSWNKSEFSSNVGREFFFSCLFSFAVSASFFAAAVFEFFAGTFADGPASAVFPCVLALPEVLDGLRRGTRLSDAGFFLLFSLFSAKFFHLLSVLYFDRVFLLFPLYYSRFFLSNQEPAPKFSFRRAFSSSESPLGHRNVGRAGVFSK